ncbi:unnamed protein product, partial [Ectocarpus sp. 12 AP-2014]
MHHTRAAAAAAAAIQSPVDPHSIPRSQPSQRATAPLAMGPAHPHHSDRRTATHPPARASRAEDDYSNSPRRPAAAARPEIPPHTKKHEAAERTDPESVAEPVST